LVNRYTLPVVEEKMHQIQLAAQRKLRQALLQLKPGKYGFTDFLETAAGQSVPIQVEVSLGHQAAGPTARFDFTGTGPVLAGNLNANQAIVTAAILYVLRLLINEEIPLNEGVLDTIEVVLPHCLLNPSRGDADATAPAVAAGNVETSQRVVDVLLGALGLAGASQGTMNNVLFGNESFGYYETVCGGSGATTDHPGADAVQCHMTNTRATDPEVLERRLPLRLLQLCIRRGSGGAGRHRGGDGVVRKLQFLQPLELSLITQRRGPHPPYGMAGGAPGALGKNRLISADGTVRILPGICACRVVPGDTLILETPGGGGFGTPPDSARHVGLPEHSESS
jgi:5-oxoprolinase (ATP-hydrolysing)